MANTAQMYLDLLKGCLCASYFDESCWKPTEIPKYTFMEVLRSPVKGFKRWFRSKMLNRFVYPPLMLYTKVPYDHQARIKGRDWPILGYSMIGFRRMENIQFCVEDVLKNDVPGDLIETGVWRGGATIFMRAILKAHDVTDRNVWLADSFEGLPKPADDADGWDLSEMSYLKVSQEQVAANFQRFELLDEQVKFIKGWFSESLPKAPLSKIAVLRMDGDLYSSTMDALKNLYHRISPGGYVIADDYYSWDSCRRAVHDFLDQQGLRPEIRKIDDDGAFWQVA